MGGGGTVWDAIAFDPDADLLYIGTGNGGPWNRDYRSPGGGDNLYLSSILALKPDTGKYVWHYQTTPGDNWDYTAVQHLLLADIRLDGRNRKVIMQAPKNGFFYVLDRITGEFISAQPYANVSWAQGIDQKTGRPITNPEAWYGPEGTTLSPGPGGAHNWAPMSYNPATGLVYLPASNSSYLYAKQPDFVFKRGEGEFQGIGRSQTAVARGGIPGVTPKAQPPLVGPEAGREIRGGGYLLAWDPVTQKERWRALGGGAIGGGTVTTAGNLVLQVVPDGRFIAYSADKGEKLLEVSTGQRGMGPPVTYQLDGRQYVSFLAGQGTLPPNPFGPGVPGAPGAPGAPVTGVAPGGAPPAAATPLAAGGGPAPGANARRTATAGPDRQQAASVYVRAGREGAASEWRRPTLMDQRRVQRTRPTRCRPGLSDPARCPGQRAVTGVRVARGSRAVFLMTSIASSDARNLTSALAASGCFPPTTSPAENTVTRWTSAGSGPT